MASRKGAWVNALVAPFAVRAPRCPSGLRETSKQGGLPRSYRGIRMIAECQWPYKIENIFYFSQSSN